jgi:hypothetical protein
VKRLLILAVLVLAAAFGAATAQADGDPASDILVFQDVYLPYPKPSPDLGSALNTAVASVNKDGMKLKVAEIATAGDLGTARSLFGRPADYAKFLGTELSYNYDGLLLVVMPAGFGLFKQDADTARFEHAVSSVNLNVSNVDDLTRTATAAVHRLGALGVKDVDRTAPHVRAFAVRAKRGAKVDLVYDVSDNSSQSREVVQVYRGPVAIATLRSPLERAHTGTLDAVHWRVPKRPGASYRFCVVATDPAGNASRPSCAAIRIAGG